MKVYLTPTKLRRLIFDNENAKIILNDDQVTESLARKILFDYEVMESIAPNDEIEVNITNEIIKFKL